MATSEERIIEQRAVVISEIEETFRSLTSLSKRPPLEDLKLVAASLYQKYAQWVEREDQYGINLGELMSKFLTRRLQRYPVKRRQK